MKRDGIPGHELNLLIEYRVPENSCTRMSRAAISGGRSEDDVVPPDEEHGVLDAEDGPDDVLGAEPLRGRNGQIESEAPARDPEIHRRPGQMASDQLGQLAGISIEEAEKELIRNTLRMVSGNREQAAKILGIGERTLYRKIKEYELTE